MHYRIAAVLLFLCSLASCIYGQNNVQQKIPGKTRILFVLDGSGSMEASWGSESRMTVAKQILTRLVDSLRVNPDLELALRIYGHRYPRQANNCQDSWLEVPFSTRNHDAIISKIKDIKPKGTTPITYSLLQSAKDFPANASGYRNILILITDGIESCGADPCAASIELQKKGVFLRPFVIGLGLKGGNALECLGRFIDSESSKSFNSVLNNSIATTFSRTSVSVDLLNGQNLPTETNINVTFLNNFTGMPAYEFIHYRDRSGKPDTVQVDPVLSYDVVVNTLPRTIRKDVNIVNGTHNVIRIPIPQGSLMVRSETRGVGFGVLVREDGKDELLNQQRSGETVRYLEGKYMVETLTLPRRFFKVSIEADKPSAITLPPTGLLNVNTTLPGIGSIFEILPSGETAWVCNLGDSQSQQSFDLLPGSYKIAFRARQSGGSKFTAVKTFEIKSGGTANVSMF